MRHLWWVLLVGISCSSRPPNAQDGGTNCEPDGGMRACGPVCVDVRNDDANCGGCGAACAASEACATGRCLPKVCSTVSCAETQVCVSEVCVDRACLGVSCPDGQSCAAGVCYPRACGGINCSVSQVCVSEQCVDAACVGVVCPTGLLCSGGGCVKNTCENGFADGTESDADCGGICVSCGTGQKCHGPIDCSSLSCGDGGSCLAPTCIDRLRNGGEGDVDCGGDCPPCADGKRCAGPAQCHSGVCQQGTCQPPSCTDTVRNGTETDLDCGGGCPGCVAGKQCDAGTDCLSQLCQAGQCVSALCMNSMKDGDETDVDCGGSCGPCADARLCLVPADCLSKVCANNPLRCQAPTCADTVQNGSETDLNCGGGTCLACAVGKKCKVGGDCASRSCQSGLCAAPSCTDGVLNGAESDKDCGGGPPCAACAGGKACQLPRDCLTNACDGGFCTNFGLLGAPLQLPAGTTPIFLLLQDLDGDGRADLAVSNETSFDINVWWSEADGGLTPGSTLQVSGVSSSRGPHGLAAGDINGDGILDLVAAREYSPVYIDGCTLTVMKGAGSRNFLAGNDFLFGVGGSGCGHRVGAGRLNSDALDDIVAGDDVRGVYGGRPDTAGGYLWLTPASGVYTSPRGLSQAGPWVVMGDVNRDGLLDFVTRSAWYSHFEVWLNQGNGVFPTAPIVGAVSAGEGDIALAQMNADTNPDLLVASSSSSRLGVALGVGDGNFVSPNGFAVNSPYGVAVGDLDGDGKKDVVVGSIGVAVLRGNGDGTLQPVEYFATGLGQVTSVVVNDFNADGKPDVVAIAGGKVWLLLNTLP